MIKEGVGADIVWSTSRNTWNSYSGLYVDCGLKRVRILITPSYMDNYRTLLPAIIQSGVKPIGLLYNSSWRSYSESNKEAFRQFVYPAVSEFKDYIDVWEIWNEPNLSSFFSDKNPAHYTEYLKVGYTEAKRADPNCFVLGGSVAWTHSTARNFIQGMYDAGAKDFMDALSHHPYCYPYAPDAHPNNPFTDLPKIKALMEANGDYNNIWITEIGWEVDGVSEDQQAAYLTEVLELSQNWGWVDCVIIYQWKDGSKHMGLVTSGIQPRRSYYAVKEWIAGNYVPPPECTTNADCVTLHGDNWECQNGVCVYVPPVEPPPTETYTVKVYIPNTGGTTEPGPGNYTIPIDELFSIAAKPEPGYEFDYWVINWYPAEASNSPAITFGVSAGIYAVRAIFKEIEGPELPPSNYNGLHAQMFPFPLVVARLAHFRDIYQNRHAWFKRIHELLHPLI